MNCFVCFGKVIRASEPMMLSNGKTTAIKFTVAAENGQLDSNGKERIDYIPCVIFNPDDRIMDLMANKNGEFYVEFQGRISTSSFEKEGEKEYRTEVIVNQRSFHAVA